MIPNYKKIQEQPVDVSVVYLAAKEADFSEYSFTTTELEYVKNQVQNEKTSIDINSYFKRSYIRILPRDKERSAGIEAMRREASKLLSLLKEHDEQEIVVVDVSDEPEMTYAFLEGFGLSQYAFLKYRTQKEKSEENFIKEIQVLSRGVDDRSVKNLEITCSAVFKARNMVNEPVSFLTASQLGKEFQQMGDESGFTVDVFSKKKIESLKLSGLLAVNKGSIDPPTFTVMEWKPSDAKNSKPIVLVGKGIVYDTGGLSLKPSSSMLGMKSDMAGAATVAGVMYAVASGNLPFHIIGLVPATDNRPDGNAYTPGDVIKMHNGKTVEVINTDAEGRIILADALSFAKQYDPELVMDFATLTGSASVAIGPQGVVAMGNADEKTFNSLIDSGYNTYERVVKLPFWEEYNEMIKSDIADIKNAGGREAGAITAGKFLEHFTAYPWIHVDIAPMAYLDKKDYYRGKGATGVGIRLFLNFISSLYNN
ncbi:MAG: leucyl aminopeptidase family protein [Bacteroidota bacterium]